MTGMPGWMEGEKERKYEKRKRKEGGVVRRVKGRIDGKRESAKEVGRRMKGVGRRIRRARFKGCTVHKF